MRKSALKGVRNVVIKIGTSILTRNGRFDKKIVAELADEVSRLLRKRMRVTLVSSGAIGSGMTTLGIRRRPTSMPALQAAAAVGQRYLMQCYEEAFARRGFSTAQVLLTWDDLAKPERFMNARRTLTQIQRWGCVPIINENDTVATDEIRFGDNDRLSSLVSILLAADVQIILSDTNGLYGDGVRIPVVRTLNDAVFGHVKDSKKTYSVGGMRSKLTAVQMSVRAGVPVLLASGRDRKVLSKLLAGQDLGTLFLPQIAKGRAKKEWLSHFTSHLKR